MSKFLNLKYLVTIDTVDKLIKFITTCETFDIEPPVQLESGHVVTNNDDFIIFHNDCTMIKTTNKQ